MGCVRIWFSSSAESFSFFRRIVLRHLHHAEVVQEGPGGELDQPVARVLAAPCPMIAARIVTLTVRAEMRRSVRPPIRMRWIISTAVVRMHSRSWATVTSMGGRSIGSPSATSSEHVLEHVDRAQVHVEAALAAGEVLQRPRCRAAPRHRRGGRLTGSPSVRTSAISNLASQSMSFCRIGMPAGHEHVVPVDVDGLVEPHPVAQVGDLDGVHRLFPRRIAKASTSATAA